MSTQFKTWGHCTNRTTSEVGLQEQWKICSVFSLMNFDVMNESFTFNMNYIPWCIKVCRILINERMQYIWTCIIIWEYWNILIYRCQQASFLHYVSNSIVVSVMVCHAGKWGSFPRLDRRFWKWSDPPKQMEMVNRKWWTGNCQLEMTD